MCLRIHSCILSLYFVALLFLSACSESATTTIYKQNFPKEPLRSMKLLLSPANAEMQATLERLYSFNQDSNFTLEVSSKSDIVCNSNHNYQTKALGEFPTSYLKMQVNYRGRILYGYYIDLQESPNAEDIRRAFSTLEEDLSL